MGKNYGGADEMYYSDADQSFHTKAELKHYGRLGMKWYQHIYGDDPRWGRNGRAKSADKAKESSGSDHPGFRVKTAYGMYSSDMIGEDRADEYWDSDKERARLAYWDELDKKYPTSKLKKSNDNPSVPPTLEDLKTAAKKVNPHAEEYEARGDGSSNNCVKCSVDLVLRLKGYDAEAYAMENGLGHPNRKGSAWDSYAEVFELNDSNGRGAGHLEGAVNFPLTKNPYKVPKKIRRQYEDYAKELAEIFSYRLGDGCYGALSCKRNGVGDHASNWAVVDGRMYAVDSQIDVVVPIEDYFQRYGWYFDGYDFLDLTNVSVKETGVGRYVDKKKFKK